MLSHFISPSAFAASGPQRATALIMAPRHSQSNATRDGGAVLHDYSRETALKRQSAATISVVRLRGAV
jgi:hypothetical protein